MMQRPITSFFQPMKAVKEEEKIRLPAEEDSANQVLEAAVMQRNGLSLCVDSPVKSAAKRPLRRVLESDSDEEEAVLTAQAEVDPIQEKNSEKASSKEEPMQTPQSDLSADSPSPSSSHSAGDSPALSDSPAVGRAGIPRRRTARKQIPKRKIELPTSREKNRDEEPSAKRCREEQGPGDEVGRGAKEEVAMEMQEVKGQHSEIELAEVNGTLEEGAVNKGEEDYAKGGAREKPVPPKPSRAISSFFAPKKVPVARAGKADELAAVEIPPAPTGSATASSNGSDGTAGSFSKPVVPLDPVEYNPSKSSYHPIQDACWGHGQRVPYLAVARTFERIEEVSARLKNIETLSNLFRSVIALSPSDILPCIYLCLNRLGPAYKGLELGIGETILMKAVAQATGRQLDQIKAEAQEKGDLGLVAESSRSNQRTMFTPPKLSAAGVFSKLQEIARMTGSASMNKKIDIIKGLFVACRHSEARYITRSLGGKLRIGLAEQSALSAIAHAVSLTPPGQGFPPEVLDAGQGKSAEARKAWLEEQTQILKQTFCELPSYDIIVPILLEHGVESLPQHCKITPGIPLKPMLAQPTKGIGEVLKRFEEAAFTCEYKYDGERAQIHILENGDVHIYSRNQEDNTSKYPDIISRIPKVKKGSVRSCILDAEAVAWDPEKRQIQPFQVLTTRKRKDVEAAEIKVQVCLYAFDILYLNGESLVKEPFSRRRLLLHNSFVETEGEFLFATSMDASSLDEISEFLDQSIKDSCEGLMVKSLEVDATYEIAKRSHKWLKLKKDYLEGVGDTLDLVVIGAYLGKGKRVGMYGGFLLACYDEESEEYQSICKIGTGFTEEILEKHYSFLKDHVLEKPRPYYRWDSSTEPNHWLAAVQVWEVKCADLSISPVHKAAIGLVDEEKGISLRFPRFLRVRDDKKPEEATTSSQVAELYKQQQQIQNQQPAEKVEEEDFY
ncbi:DNA ligase 1 isoform X1 [Dermochelys coriacea]|uniref:DNA ligase 1 isoform X1 n=2 Tax=Dermochelys coriacea TaxID=27794 RepID=UPI0018E7DC72|nr:DNA ligase 1 isoform X1 [Dermochelys coriacea]XP_038237006.1 DNA ligase 1 isoform X1 [Dermochelys coriacea]XP_043357218.1 DNA ligase 1 isoform X1 [Dermochelys coriacea]